MTASVCKQTGIAEPEFSGAARDWRPPAQLDAATCGELARVL